jgi:hypothetical protein
MLIIATGMLELHNHCTCIHSYNEGSSARHAKNLVTDTKTQHDAKLIQNKISPV